MFCIHKKDAWYDIYSFLKNYDMMIKILTKNFNDIYSEWNTRNSWKNGRERESVLLGRKDLKNPGLSQRKRADPSAKLNILTIKNHYFICLKNIKHYFIIYNWRKCIFSFYFLTFFHFGSYILILLFLVPKSISACHIGFRRQSTNRKSWRDWRHY